MSRPHAFTPSFSSVFGTSQRTAIGVIVMASLMTTGCMTNYSTQGAYGVPSTELTIPQRLLDNGIEYTAKVNIYALQKDLKQNSRLNIDSFNSEVLLSGEVPTAAIKTQIEQLVSSMPDVKRVYNELQVSAARGYSATVQDNYLSSKMMAKATANNAIKASQITAVTNSGIVYIMGQMTPIQQNNLIAVANSTAGITELVLLTTLVDDRGVPISSNDIMFENNPNQPASIASTANPEPIVTPNIPTPNVIQPASTAMNQSSSPYIELYKNK